MKTHDPDKAVARVLAVFKRASNVHYSMARAVFVVDENVDFLGPSLKEANFRVFVPHKGMTDPQIKEELLAHRIIVTRNTKDFIDDAPIYDYGIIGLEGLPFVDSAPKLANNTTARPHAQT